VAGLKYQLIKPCHDQADKLSIQDVPVLSASIRIVDTARDLHVGGHRQWLNDVWPRHCRLSFGLLPAASGTNDCALTVGWRQNTLVQSFVSCRLDYCNALLYGISGGLIQRLQSVQNAAARRINGASRRDHITPVLGQLHWHACETENWLQIGGACLQIIAWSCSAVPVGRLSTRHGRGTSTSQVFRRLHVCRPTDTVTDWWQEFLCSQAAAIEQPTDRDPKERHYIRTLYSIT